MYLILSCTWWIGISHRKIVLLNLGGQWMLTRKNDGNVVDREVMRMPYVDEMVKIVVKLNECFIDFPIFLLAEKKLLLLLVVILTLEFLVLWKSIVQENLLRKLWAINVWYSFNQMLELITISIVLEYVPCIPPHSVSRYNFARGKRLHLLKI